MKQLPYKQRKFVANYILLAGNGVKAVYAAGYQQGYFAAGVTAYRLLKKPKIMAEIESHVRKSKLNADQVIEELSNIAQIKTEIDGTQRLKALELLGKFHKLFVDKVETSDTSQQEGAKAAILSQITALVESKQLSQEQVARELYAELRDDPNLGKHEYWPAFTFETPDNSNPVSEIAGEQ